jgi:hypothetical protein
MVFLPYSSKILIFNKILQFDALEMSFPLGFPAPDHGYYTRTDFLEVELLLSAGRVTIRIKTS